MENTHFSSLIFLFKYKLLVDVQWPCLIINQPAEIWICSVFHEYVYIYTRIFILQCVLTGGSTTTKSGAFWGGYNGNIIGNYKVLPQFRIAKLVEIPNRTIGFMNVYARHIRPVSGVYKPTNTTEQNNLVDPFCCILLNKGFSCW